MTTSDRPPTPVALVTGGAKRVGAAIAEELAKRGLDTIITYNTSKDEADAHARSLREENGVRTWAVACDLADPDAAARTCLEAAREAGRLDVLVHNASAYHPTPLDELDWKHVRDLYAINAASPLLITAALAPMLTTSTMPGGGAVVAMADIHALGRPRKRFSAYSMSKAALAELVRTLARELAPQDGKPGARANAVAPGVVAWPESGYESDAASQEAYLRRVPLQRAGTPQDAAKLVAALALDHTYVNGEIVRLDGGRWLA
ncbi:MAG: SDR family oxidoreductase [Phycisphaera sp.]|nr:MAG: SDR family oxidoreductase [Phycisphaera sp.]